jgi:hypothetical protein
VGTRRAPERLLSVLVGADYGALLRLNSSSGDAREDGQELREPGTLDSVLKVLCPAVAAEALMHVIGLYRLRALHRFLHALGRASLLGLRPHAWHRHSCCYLPGLQEMVSRADAQRATRGVAWLLMESVFWTPIKREGGASLAGLASA